MVDLGHLHGFLPASQVSRERRQRAVGDTAGDRWGEMVGEQAMVKVIEADQTRERLIVSERAAFREDRAARKGQLLSELEPGQIRKGRVTSLASFGAFVDVGGVDGLIHVSELGWRHINHPSEVVKIGQEIDVQVLSVDRERQRIALSSKVLEPNPWVEVAKSYQEGQLVLGGVAASGIALWLGDFVPGSIQSPWIYLPLMAVAGVLAGGIWAVIPAILKAYLKVNEIITTLMLNYVAILWYKYLICHPAV